MTFCSHIRVEGVLTLLLLAVSIGLCAEEIENPDNGHAYQKFDH
jgi:hypothetical protein